MSKQINLFPYDKNYLLREAQELSRDELLKMLLEDLKQAYQIHFNPLGLGDETSLRVQSYTYMKGHDELNGVYSFLAGAYRLKHGSSQLEIIFDGRTPQQKYRDDWQQQYDLWLEDLLQDARILKTFLKITVFRPDSSYRYTLSNQLLKLIGEKLGVEKKRKIKGQPAFMIA
ncbi:MAG: hypothetical protein LAT68_00150 [Cyclobacteriaceae bacterium]|nr:hypothetical protein [Cyclobacteriaceae bacterium]MCH8514712.1 hypothetical protein [Cyclobacteriaceae bacterium]